MIQQLSHPESGAVGVQDGCSTGVEARKFRWDGSELLRTAGADVDAGMVEELLSELSVELLFAPETQECCCAVNVGDPALWRISATEGQPFKCREEQDT